MNNSQDSQHDRPSGNTATEVKAQGAVTSRRKLLAYIGTTGATALFEGASLGFVNSTVNGNKGKLDQALQSGIVVSATIEELRAMVEPDPQHSSTGPEPIRIIGNSS